MHMISLLLMIATQAADAPKPKFGTQATRLYRSQEYVRKNPAPDFWAMMPYYWAQQSGASCSLASISMMINAARANQSLTAADELVTEKSLAEKLSENEKVQGVAKAKHGLTLDELGQAIAQALAQYGFKNAKVDVFHVDKASPESLSQLKEALSQNEKSTNDFIVINFLQSELTGDPEGAIGHISPIAAYDKKKGKVLIFDPDRQYYEPYWVSDKTLLAGMATKDSGAEKNRGYVWIQLNAKK